MNSMKYTTTKRSILIQNRARHVRQHRNRQDQMESAWVFTYWEAGAKTPSQLHPDCKVFGSLGKSGEWRPANELNKAYVKNKTKNIRVHLWWVSRWSRRLLVVTGARCPLTKPVVTAVELQAATEPHCSRGVQPGGIYVYVVHREPAPGGPGSGMRRGRRRFLC
jgi:hypothetical protein